MTTYTARRLPVHRGPAAWAAILGEYTPGPALDGIQTADVTIIGAGFAGLSAALRVHQLDPAARVIVLDACAVAEGAAGRNSGFMIDLPHDLASDDYAGANDDRQLIALNRQAQQFAQNAVEAFGIRPDYFDPVGKINGAVSDMAHAHNLSYAQHLTGLGETSEFIDRQQMKEVTGSDYYQSGLYTPGTVMLQPAGYIRGLTQGLKRAGVAVFENSPVHRFKRIGSGWTVETANGKVETGKIILTTNGHLESFGVERGRLMQIFLFASMTEELGADALRLLGGHSRWGITPSDPMGTTMRRIDTGQGGNRVVTRTCAVLRPGLQTSAGDLARTARVMRGKFDDRYPQLAGTRMEHVWAGHLCLSLNGVSVTRQIDDGVYSGCVQNGLGTARGTLTGIAAAEMACGATSDVLSFFQQEERPKRLPPQPIRQIGANAVLRWREWKARAE
ncbi:MAG: NAD(P)/FAD-dependent oxidoreductase [Paracoccaceae bacterium]